MTPMSDHDALLAAVLAAPDDDLPRLVYADYLDEAGDSDRAEFIRVQIELARRPVDDSERPALLTREAELLAEHRPAWVILDLKGSQQFRRGFVEAVRTTAAALLAAAARIFGTAPVRSLHLQQTSEHVDALVRLKWLDRIEKLNLSNSFLAAGGRLERLLTDAPLGSLRRLVIRNSRLWPETLPQISRSPVAGRLHALDLSGNPLGDAGLAALATSQSLAGINELALHSHDQRDEESAHTAGATALARSGTLTHLHELALSGHHISDAGLIDLVTSRNARRLTRLDLSENDLGSLGADGYEALVSSPYLGRLRSVDLSGGRNRVDRLAAETLAGWSRLADGVRVDLRGCDLDPAGRSALLASPWADRFLLDPPDGEGTL